MHFERQAHRGSGLLKSVTIKGAVPFSSRSGVLLDRDALASLVKLIGPDLVWANGEAQLVEIDDAKTSSAEGPVNMNEGRRRG